MSLYTFYPCLPNGRSLTFEARELADDAAAEALALAVLDDHPTSAYVVVWNGTREVWTRRRPSAMQDLITSITEPSEASSEASCGFGTRFGSNSRLPRRS